MAKCEIVSRQDWLEARLALLEDEKKLTRQRDKVSARRRSLPWVRVEKDYSFEGPDGRENLEDLFAGRSQLVVYHFMFGPEWEEGCKSCSFWADSYQGAVVHLAQRDTTMVTVSRAPLERLEAFKRRMGWNFKWVSSAGSDFNFDFEVSFSPEDIEKGETAYNYKKGLNFGEEAPGLSVFAADGSGAIFHTYSCYARGLEPFNAAYGILDLVPKGRDEDDLSYPMEWVRLHDTYPSD